MFGVLRVDWNQVLFLPNQVQCYMGTWIVRLRLEKAIGDLTDLIGKTSLDGTLACIVHGVERVI